MVWLPCQLIPTIPSNYLIELHRILSCWHQILMNQLGLPSRAPVNFFPSCCPPCVLRHYGSQDTGGFIRFKTFRNHMPHTVGAGGRNPPMLRGICIDPHIEFLGSASPLEVTNIPSMPPDAVLEAPSHTLPTQECSLWYDDLIRLRPAAHLDGGHTYSNLVVNQYGTLKCTGYAAAEDQAGRVHHHEKQ